MDNTSRWVRAAEIALLWCCIDLAEQNVLLAKEVKQATALADRGLAQTDRCLDHLEPLADAIDWSQQDVCE
jgi:hypothetical protein